MSDNNQEFDSEFFREAVADAKTIRETAIENAKDHLEEAFTPKLQSMLSQTIQQEMEGEEEMDDENGGEDKEDIELDLSDLPDEEEEDEEEENGDEEEADDEEEGEDVAVIDVDVEDEEDMEEIADQDQLDLDSVMEFLEAATMDDRHDNPDTSDDLSDDNEHMYGDDMLDTGEFEDGYESDNQEPIMDDVNKIAQELEEETDLQEELEDEMVNAFMDLLSEDEEEMNETVFEVDLDEYGVTDTDRDPMDSVGSVSEPYDTEAEYEDDEGNGVDVGNEPYDPEGPGGGADERNRMDDLEDPLEEETTYDLSALLEEDEDNTLNEAEALRQQNQELKEELSKHRQAIKILREQINETNLINSKLLYTNRLFKKFGLSDQEKMRVIESFDRAKNTREAKLIYTSLAENLNNKSSGQQVNESRKTNKKQKLVEALEGGRSSQKTGGSTTPSDDKKQILNENEDMKSRLQKLANVNQ